MFDIFRKMKTCHLLQISAYSNQFYLMANSLPVLRYEYPTPPATRRLTILKKFNLKYKIYIFYLLIIYIFLFFWQTPGHYYLSTIKAIIFTFFAMQLQLHRRYLRLTSLTSSAFRLKIVDSLLQFRAKYPVLVGTFLTVLLKTLCNILQQ